VAQAAADSKSASCFNWQYLADVGQAFVSNKKKYLSPTVSTVIVNYNAGRLLGDCVSSALLAGVAQVMVVDNGSTDGSLEAVERINEANLRLIRNGENLGFAAACNIGIGYANAEHILFLNPDGTITRGALDRMLEVLESAPDIGMVGGRLCNLDGSEQQGGRRTMPTPWRALLRATGLHRLAGSLFGQSSDFNLHNTPLPDGPVAVEAISGACMLVKRAAIEDVGLWDEDYFLHCEDLDWCMRFDLKGWRVMFVPDAIVTHEKGACSRSRPVFVEWHKHKGMLRFYEKYYRHRYSRWLWWLVVAGVWLRFGAVATYHSTVRRLRHLAPGHG
jgi:hypothetical protein